MDEVSGRLRFRGDDGDLGADQSINEAGFADVGAADERDKSGPQDGTGVVRRQGSAAILRAALGATIRMVAVSFAA